MTLEAEKRLLLYLVEQHGTSLSELSRRLGRNHAYLHQYVHRGSPRRLPEEARAELGKLLGVDPDALKPEGRHGLREPAPPPPDFTPPLGGWRPSRARAAPPAGRDLPILGPWLPEHQAHDLASKIQGYVERPPGLAGNPQAFALIHHDRAMWPRWRAGEILVVNPLLPVRPEDLVLAEQAGLRRGVVRQFLGDDMDWIRLRHFHPAPAESRLPAPSIRRLYRITQSFEPV